MKRLCGLAFILALAIAGCGGGGSSTPSAPSLQTAQGTTTIIIPNKIQSSARAPKFVSPSVVSAKLSIAGIADQIFDLSSGSRNCATQGDGRVCTISIVAPVGQQAATLTLYDAANAGGNSLGTSQTTISATAGQPFTVGFTVNGAVASIVVNVNVQNGGFIVGQTNQGQITVTAKDADGNVITGPGTYAVPVTITNSDTSGAFTLQATSISGPGTGVLVSYNGRQVSGTVTIGASATGVSTITPAVVFGGSSTPTPAPSGSGTASPTATAAPSATGLPDPGANCGAPTVGAGTYTTISSFGNVSGGVYTANSSSSTWIKLTYAGSATPTAAPTATAAPTTTGTQSVDVYFGTYTLASGTNGCAIFAASSDGSPIGLYAGIGSFNGIAIATPKTTASVTGLVGTGAVTSLSITLNGSTGSGSISLSGGDTGTISVSGKTTVLLPTSGATAAPSATFGPVQLSPNFLSFSSVGQQQNFVATQSGNAANTFTAGSLSCPGGVGSASISQSSPGLFTVTAQSPSTGNCTVPITGIGGISSTMTIFI